MWETTDTAPKSEILNTMIADKDGVRNQQKLIFDGKLWWYPDGSMYVYYTPTHWERNT
jgi:hypothetical protein